MIDTSLAPRHQPVKVGPTNRGSIRPKSDRQSNVSAITHSRIYNDGDVWADCSSYRRHKVEWDRGSIELATAVVGELQAIHSEVQYAR